MNLGVALARIKSCPTSKVKHETQADALAVIAEMRRNGLRKKGHVLQAYRCTQCQCWHVGNSSTKTNRRVRRRRMEREGRL